MAAGIINLQKASGGITKISSADGIGVTELVVPESGELATKFIGSFITAYTVFNNCIVAFGGEFNRTDYPKLWAYLQANPSLVKTQAQWQTEATANGGICGFFSDGDGTTTFRVPNLDKAFLRPDSRGAGGFQSDAFQGHWHNTKREQDVVIGSGYNRTRSDGGGILSAQGAYDAVSDGLNGTPRTANETRPKNIAVLPLIVAK